MITLRFKNFWVGLIKQDLQKMFQKLTLPRCFCGAQTFGQIEKLKNH